VVGAIDRDRKFGFRSFARMHGGGNVVPKRCEVHRNTVGRKLADAAEECTEPGALLLVEGDDGELAPLEYLLGEAGKH